MSVTLDLRKIPQSGDMSHRGFLSRFFGHWRFWKFSGFGFFFALFGERLRENVVWGERAT